MKHVVYILTVKLFTSTDAKFLRLVCNCYWKIEVYIGLKLDKPVCDILKRDIAVDSELFMLSLVHLYEVICCLNLNSFLVSRRVEIYTFFSRNFFSLVLYSFYTVGMGHVMRVSVSLDLNTHWVSIAPPPPTIIPLLFLIYHIGCNNRS